MAAASTTSRNTWWRRSEMPEHLTWFKWESYATWLSGFAMLCIVYYAGADLFLIDRNVLDVPAWAAILISLASLARRLAALRPALQVAARQRTPTLLMVLLYRDPGGHGLGLHAALHRPRGASCISAPSPRRSCRRTSSWSSFPNQKIVVADLMAGRTPDPKYGKIAKQRSPHNNYLTLPVLFLMLSNHYPLAFAHASATGSSPALVFLMGVTDPALFQHHACAQGQPDLDLAGDGDHLHHHHVAVDARRSQREELARAVADAEAASPRRRLPGGGATRCSGAARCATPPSRSSEGIHHAPKGVMLETDAADRRACPRDLPAGRPQPRHAARQRHRRSSRRSARQIVDWYRAAVSG